MGLWDKLKKKLPAVDLEKLRKQTGEAAEKARNAVQKNVASVRKSPDKKSGSRATSQGPSAPSSQGESFQETVKRKVAQLSDTAAAAQINELQTQVTKNPRNLRIILGSCVVVCLLLIIVLIFGESGENQKAPDPAAQWSAARSQGSAPKNAYKEITDPAEATRVLDASLPGRHLSPADREMLMQCMNRFFGNPRLDKACMLEAFLKPMDQTEINGFYLTCAEALNPAAFRGYPEWLMDKGVPEKMIRKYLHTLSNASREYIDRNQETILAAAERCARLK